MHTRDTSIRRGSKSGGGGGGAHKDVKKGGSHTREGGQNLVGT